MNELIQAFNALKDDEKIRFWDKLKKESIALTSFRRYLNGYEPTQIRQQIIANIFKSLNDE